LSTRSWIERSGSDIALRRELLSRIHKGVAFWWLPNFEDRLFIQKGLALSETLIVRQCGQSYLEIMPPRLASRFDKETILDDLPLEYSCKKVVQVSSDYDAVWFGMFNPTLPNSLAELAIRETPDEAHSGYPQPIRVYD
jgi:hypothetical protein